MKYSMASGDSADPSGRNRSSRSTHLAAWSWVINERRPTMDLMSGGLLVSETMERRWTRASLSFWRLEAQIESPVRLLRAATLPTEVAKLGDRGTWAGVIGGITVGPKVASTLDTIRVLEGDGEGTVAMLVVHAEMSAAKDGTDIQGAFLYL